MHTHERAAPLAAFEGYCDGYFAATSPRYLLGISVTVGVTPNSLPCPGSTLLDEINAFDLAEVSGANLGQLNVITVSSFCGPNGQIWGYDLCPPEAGHAEIGVVTRGDQTATMLDLEGLTAAFARLVGTVARPRFPFMPGSHVPAAMKSKTVRHPSVLYAALAIGIPEDRSRDACLLMENPGVLPEGTTWDAVKPEILHSMAQSVLAVGANQRVRYQKIFVGAAHAVIGPDQTGCAVAMAPYFRLAQAAYPSGEALTALTLEQWEARTAPLFANARG